MFSNMNDSDRICNLVVFYRYMATDISDASIELCKDWKNKKGRKNKRYLASQHGGSESTWKKIL